MTTLHYFNSHLLYFTSLTVFATDLALYRRVRPQPLAGADVGKLHSRKGSEPAGSEGRDPGPVGLSYVGNAERAGQSERLVVAGLLPQCLHSLTNTGQTPAQVGAADDQRGWWGGRKISCHGYNGHKNCNPQYYHNNLKKSIFKKKNEKGKTF